MYPRLYKLINSVFNFTTLDLLTYMFEFNTRQISQENLLNYSSYIDIYVQIFIDKAKKFVKKARKFNNISEMYKLAQKSDE